MTFREESYARFRRRLKRLAEMVADDVPSLIVADVLLGVLDYAEWAFPDDLAAARKRRRQVELRQRLGYCQSCETKLPPIDTHPPYCDACEIVLD